MKKQSLVWSAISQFVRMVCSLYTIPLCLNYLGTERYGCWMTVMSLFIFSSFFDFGYTLYIRNRLNDI